MFKVEDVPMPREVRPSKYPWDEMEIGQSFFIDARDLTTRPSGKAQSIRNDAKKHGYRAKVRAVVGVTSTGEAYEAPGDLDQLRRCTGLRVWRVAVMPYTGNADDADDE